jgi:hypothetical protein
VVAWCVWCVGINSHMNMYMGWPMFDLCCRTLTGSSRAKTASVPSIRRDGGALVGVSQGCSVLSV